jgi:hypothetical protein
VAVTWLNTEADSKDDAAEGRLWIRLLEEARQAKEAAAKQGG